MEFRMILQGGQHCVPRFQGRLHSRGDRQRLGCLEPIIHFHSRCHFQPLLKAGKEMKTHDFTMEALLLGCAWYFAQIP